MGFLLTSFEQGLIYALLAMGVYISYRILDISDLTVEGAFAFGAFIFAKCVYSGMSPISATLTAFAVGSLAGLFTSLLFTKMKIRPLLAGILTMTILYSVNLRTMGKANIALKAHHSIFNQFSAVPKWLVLVIIVMIVKLCLDMFFRTEMGYLLIATGDNERLVTSIGENSNKYKVIGMMISNALAAMSGALFCQDLGFVDISLSNSIIVTGLASVIIGEAIKKNSNVIKGTTRAIVGSVVYKEISGIAIAIGLAPTDLRAIGAIIVIIFLSYNNFSVTKPNIDNIIDGAGKILSKNKNSDTQIENTEQEE